MFGFSMGEAAARITLDIADLAGKHKPEPPKGPAIYKYTPPRSIAVILAEIRRATIPALRPEDV